MIVTFRSAASSDVIMFGDVAKRMLEIMGKETGGSEGIVTVEQLPDAIQSLKSATANDKAQQARVSEDARPLTEKTQDGGQRPFVSLMQRATPLIELLEWSLKKNKPVTWS
jgi:Domain of unknown function (DUF1840)